MTRKELKVYADEMDKKYNRHYGSREAHYIKDKRIASASRTKIRLIERLKNEGMDVCVDILRDWKGRDANIDWFDVHIPAMRLSIKFCDSDEQRSEVFQKYRTYNILLLDSDNTSLNYCLNEIAAKLTRMYERQQGIELRREKKRAEREEIARNMARKKGVKK